MNKAIVTGANGFVGRFLVRELAAMGYEIWAVVRGEKTDVSCLRPAEPHMVYCEMERISELPAKLPPEAQGSCFFHLAWAGASGPARADHEMQLRSAAACANAARAAKEIGCSRFVGVGSVTQLVYRDCLRDPGGVNIDLLACYAIGKIAAEYLTRCICEDVGIAYNWVYIANSYGVEDTKQDFIGMLIREYLLGHTPDLTPGEQYVDFTYISDIARGLLAVGDRGKAGDTYYIGCGQPRPLKEFVTLVRDRIAPDLDTGLGRKEFSGLAIQYEQIDVDKLHRDTGFTPLVEFRDGLEETIRWVKQRDGIA